MISGEIDPMCLDGLSSKKQVTPSRSNESKLLSFFSTDSSGTPGSVQHPFVWMSPVKSYMKYYISIHPYWFPFDTPSVRFALSSKTKGPKVVLTAGRNTPFTLLLTTNVVTLPVPP